MRVYFDPEEIRRMEAVATFLRDRLLLSIPLPLGCRVARAIDIRTEDMRMGRGLDILEAAIAPVFGR